jgi:plasmid stabilization system protein ParE
MRALIVEPEAEDEIAAALDWYEEQQSGLGAALMVEIDTVMDALRESTVRGLGVPGVRHDLAVRRVLLERFPYAVIFIEQLDAVHVLALAHHKRRPGYWRERLHRP